MRHGYCSLLILGLLAIHLSCSLEKTPEFSWVKLSVEGQKNRRSSYFLAESFLTPLSASSPSPPSTVAGFQCIGINVVGDGIASRKGEVHSADEMTALLAGNYCTRAGITSTFIDLNSGGTIGLRVPSGSHRLIQVLGFLSEMGCPADRTWDDFFFGGIKGGDLMSPPFEIGRKIVDLFSNQTVEIQNQYSLDLVKNLADPNCKNTWMGAFPSSSPSPSPSPEPTPVYFTDSSDIAQGFGGGVKSAVIWSTGNDPYSYLTQTTAGTNGVFTSRVFDSGSSTTTWPVLSWVPADRYKKGFPDAKGSEFSMGYADGLTAAQMSSNVLLIHFDGNGGSVDYFDKSGNTSISANACGSGSCPSLDANGVMGGAVSFDGLKFYQIAPGALSLSGADYTISVWIKPTASGITQGIFGRAYSATNIDYDLKLNAGKGAFWTHTNSVTKIEDFNPAPAGEWHQFAVVRSGTLYYLYKDCVSLGNAGPVGVDSGTPANTFIGYTTPSATKFNGSVDELAVWTTAINSTDMKTLCRKGAADILFQVRTCNMPDCSDGTFVGPGNLTGTYYSEADNTQPAFPSIPLSALSPARYFQYKVGLQSNYSYLASSPRLVSVTVTALK